MSAPTAVDFGHRAGQVGLHRQHLPGGSGEGLGYLVHCDPVAREVIWLAAVQVLVVPLCRYRVDTEAMPLGSQALHPHRSPESPTPHEVSLDPCVEDNDS